MGRIAALGEPHRIQALAVAGVKSLPASTADEVVAAWRELPDDVAVLILTSLSEAALAGHLDERRNLLVTVLR